MRSAAPALDGSILDLCGYPAGILGGTVNLV